MNNAKCPVCNKKSVEPINLRCQHHPCFQCASQIINVDHQSTLQIKYRIVCPLCHKKTITYDLRHLIINATEQDQDLFVTAKFINKKPEIIAKKVPNIDSEKINTHSKRNSFQGIINMSSSNRPINLECKKHSGSNIQYFCDQCYQKSHAEAFLCIQCAKNHQHRLINVREAEQRIQTANQKKRQLVIPVRKKYLDDSLKVLNERKQIINGQFQTLFKQIADEFKLLYLHINQQYEQIKKQVKFIYTKQSEQIKNNISFAQRLKQNLIGLEKINSQCRSQIQTQVNYSICLADIQVAIQTGKLKLSQKYETPKLLKKTSAILGSCQKLFQIQTCRFKTNSKPTTPTNSARNINYSFEGNKIARNQARLEQGVDVSTVKQNFYPLSPKGYLFTSKLNI